MAHHEEDSRSLQASRDCWRYSLTVCIKRLRASEAEKQQLLGRVEELLQELRIVHRQLDLFQGQQMAEISSRRRAALDYYRDSYARTHPDYSRDGDESGGGCDTVD